MLWKKYIISEFQNLQMYIVKVSKITNTTYDPVSVTVSLHNILVSALDFVSFLVGF